MFKQDEAMLRLAAMPLDHLFIQEYLNIRSGTIVIDLFKPIYQHSFQLF